MSGAAQIYDVEGCRVSVVENGLEHPPIDPIDLILIFGSLGRVAFRSLFRTVFKDAAEAGAARALTKGAAPMLRTLHRGAVQRELKLTVTTASHMADPDRYIPLSILQLALRYGERAPDPRKAAGPFQYTMRKFGTGANNRASGISRLWSSVRTTGRSCISTIIGTDDAGGIASLLAPGVRREYKALAPRNGLLARPRRTAASFRRGRTP